MKITTCLLIISVFFVCAGCPYQDDKPDSVITIINNSSEDILHFVEYRIPTDSTLPVNSIFPTSENISIAIINTNSERAYRDSWIRAFESNPDKVLMLYLFSKDTIEQVAWEKIVDDYKILHRYDFTLMDLEVMDWKVEYP
jgi:hypothetical protein